MKILITCATGRLGLTLVPALVTAGHNVTVLSRSAAKVKGLFAGIDAVEGDMTDFEFLRTTMQEYEGLVLIGSGATELIASLYAVEAAQDSPTLRHIVYLGGQNLEAMAAVPTVAAKLVTEGALLAGTKPATLLRPSTFMQNDLSVLDTIRSGVYPLPFGDVGVARVDLHDVAAAVLAVLGNSDTFGRTYTLGGPHNLTGEQIAATWSAALAAPVHYEPLPLSELESFARHTEGVLAHSIRGQYTHYQAGALLISAEELAEFAELLQRQPHSFSDFVSNYVVNDSKPVANSATTKPTPQTASEKSLS